MIRKYEFANKFLSKAIEENKIANSYLFVGNQNVPKLELAKDFAKMIYCGNKKNNLFCDKCYFCNSINEERFSEFIIVNPEGLTIKKEDILLLKEEFSKEGIENSKRIYVIVEADRMNSSAANSLLKFLEEPESDIVAILTTSTPNRILETIRSRSQTIIFNDETISDFDLYNSDEFSKEAFQKVKEFLVKIESSSDNVFINEKNMWLDTFDSKEKFSFGIDLIINIYIDIINYFYLGNLEKFKDQEDFVKKILDKVEIEKIISRVSRFVEIEERNKYNSNLNLLLDKLILEFE